MFLTSPVIQLHRNSRSLITGCMYKCFNRHRSSKPEQTVNIFNRKAKRMQRDRSALNKDYMVFEYLREEIGWRVADRIMDVKRKFDVGVDVGCGRGYISRHVYEDMVGTLYQMDLSRNLLEQAVSSPEVPTVNVQADEEFFPFKANCVDLVVSSLSLHWVNDLPGTFRQINQALRNDGCFIGSMFGGDTLFELRVALQLAETEREGGFSAHVSPFTTVQDLGNLLTRSGFVMTTIDVDDLTIRYPTMFELMDDLKGMAENNCAWQRRAMIPRDTLQAAAAIYEKMYSESGKEGVPATYQTINFIAWKPHPKQKAAAARGSGQVSLKNIAEISKLTDQMNALKRDGITDEATLAKLSEITKELEKLNAMHARSGRDDSDDS